MAVQFSKSSALQSLSMTPLIDVVFLLLIFFLVATRFAEEDRELDVTLPSASEAKPLIVKPRDVFINIDQQGNYFLGSRQMDVSQLERALAQIGVNNPLTQSVKIRADRRCTWQHVAVAIDLCHRAGIHDVKATAGADET